MAGRSWSPEQREQQRQRMRNMKRRQAGLPEDEPAPAPVAVPAKDEAADEFKELAARLYKVADDREQRVKVLDELEGFLAKLNPKDYPELAQSETVMRFIDLIAERKAEQNKDDPPGTIYGRGTMAEHKKAWTELDLRKSDIAKVEFEVNENESVIWQGLRRDYEPGITYTDYRCFVDLIREKNRNLRLAVEHTEYMFKQRNTLTDRGMATLGSARVRGSADRGSFRPAAGLFEPEYGAGGGDEETA